MKVVYKMSSRPHPLPPTLSSSKSWSSLNQKPTDLNVVLLNLTKTTGANRLELTLSHA